MYAFNLNEISKSIVHLSIDFIRQKGQIIDYSSNAPEFFGYAKNDFNFIDSVTNLIPEPISKIHENLIDQFNSTKKSKFYCNIGECLAINKSGELLPINKSFSLNNVKMSDLQVECFISLNQYYAQNKIVIQILDTKYDLLSTSYNLWQLLEMDDPAKISSKNLAAEAKTLGQVPYAQVYPKLADELLVKMNTQNDFTASASQAVQTYQIKHTAITLVCDIEIQRKCKLNTSYYVVTLQKINKVS